MATANEQVASLLRDRIVRGRWAPGQKLPARTRLARELGSCVATLQAAVGQLVEEGFLRVGPRKNGTAVAPHPPHLSRYRLVFPFGPDAWGQFWHALEAAARERTGPEREFSFFYGLEGHRDIAEYRAVADEVRTKRVAGLIFASSADELKGTPLLEQPDVPRVAIASEYQLPGVPKVGVNLESFMEQAVGILAKQGRRRVAILCGSRQGGLLELFHKAMVRRRLEIRPSREQFASLRNPDAARNLMELLLERGRRERPDGLIIADDNLVTAATEGLARAGVRGPRDLSVVALCNFPNVLPAAVPVTRIGFDVPGLLDLLVERLNQSIRGERTPAYTEVAAIAEEAYIRREAVTKEEEP